MVEQNYRPMACFTLLRNALFAFHIILRIQVFNCFDGIFTKARREIGEDITTYSSEKLRPSLIRNQQDRESINNTRDESLVPINTMYCAAYDAGRMLRFYVNLKRVGRNVETLKEKKER